MPRLPELSRPDPARLYRWVFFCLPLWGGLFFTRQWCAALALHCLFLAWQVRRQGRLLLPRPGGAACAAVLTAGAVWNLAAGIDPGAAAQGLLWLAGCLVFGLLLCQWRAEQRRALLDLVPGMGCCMVLLCLAGWFVPPLRDLWFENGRMAGPFSYANAFGLFLVLGLVLTPRCLRGWPAVPAAAVLTAGVLLSESRGALLVLGVWCVWYGVTRRPRLRRALPAVLAGAAVAAVGGSAVLARFAGNMTTLWGRLLYMKDGLRLLLRAPLGVGRLGWFYLQGLVQTGVYNVRFVHNDWLQFALDYGLPAALTLGLFLVLCLRRGAISPDAALVLLAHCFWDVDIPFTALALVLLLTLSPAADPPRRSVSGRGTAAVLALLVLCALPPGAADAADRLGRLDAAVRIAPWDIELAVERMLTRDTLTQAAADARRITAANACQATAWQILAREAADLRRYDDMAQALHQVLALKKYDQSVYDEALSLYGAALQNGWTPAAREMVRVLDQLDAAMDAADPWAWRLNETPQLYISQDLRVQIRLLARTT